VKRAYQAGLRHWPPAVGWRKALRDSARQAHFGGPMILGADLMTIPVGKKNR
jgi:hypothetical protein